MSAIARTLSNLARPNDLVGRWGGEEFVVSLPYTTERQAGLVAEKLRAAIAELSLCDAKGDRIPLTASIGVAERRATEQLEVTVDRADRAMYRAKVTGRNRVSLSSEDTVAVSIIPTRGPRISYGPAARRGAEVLERLLERAEQPHF